MRERLCALAIASAALCPLSAFANTTDRGIQTRSEAVVASYDNGAVILEVTRTFENTSPKARGLDERIDLPEESAVSELSIRRSVGWQQAAILSSKEAGDRYQSVMASASGDNRHVGPMLAEWIAADQMQVSIWPVPAKTSVSIRYRVTTYPCLWAGRVAAEIPLASPSSRLRPRSGSIVPSNSSLAGELVGACPHLGGSTDAKIVVFGGPKPGLVGSWATKGLSSKRTVADLRLVVGELSKAPKNARVVFAVDTSKSQGEAGIASQLARVRDFAAQLPDARYQVVVYRRFAQPLLRSWTMGSDLPKTLKGVPDYALAPDNGSRLDRGLDVSLALLASHRGPRRIIAFTDKLTASTHGPGTFAKKIAAKASGDTVLHLASARGSSFVREWNGPFAELASLLGGIYATVSSDGAADRESMMDLVRPRVLERIVARRVGAKDGEELAEVGALREGQAFSNLSALDESSDSVVVEGMLWSRKVRRVLPRSAKLSTHLGAFALGAELVTEAEGTTLALAESLLSQWTSFFAPSKHPVGLRNSGAGFGTSGYGSSSCCGCRMGRSRVVNMASELSFMLEPRVRGCMARHGSGSVALTVETTGDEIVDVRTGATSKLGACIVEAAWELDATGGVGRMTSEYAIGPGATVRYSGASITEKN